MTDRRIAGSVEVDANISEVWDAWTTESGIKSFFAPACNIELKPGGSYEIFFNPEGASGERGADDMQVMAFQKHKMISFTWNAPPHLPEVRKQRTHVTIRFSEVNSNSVRTKVSLFHDGWGIGGEWDEAFNYFTHAWLDIVLPKLVKRFQDGPVNWENIK